MDYMQWNMIATWLIEHFAVQFSGKQRNGGCQYAELVKSIKILQWIVHLFFLRLQVAEIVNDCALIDMEEPQNRYKSGTPGNMMQISFTSSSKS